MLSLFIIIVDAVVTAGTAESHKRQEWLGVPKVYDASG